MDEGQGAPACIRKPAPTEAWSEDLALTGLLPVGRIVTIRGELAADTVEAGDIVMVLVRPGYRPVQRVVEILVDLARRPDAAPVLMTKDAIDRFSPTRTTVLAPQCLVGLDDRLVPAADLVNGRSIRRLPAVGYIRYLQFEMEEHELLVADGLRVACLSRGMGLCRPLIAGGADLDQLRARIAERIPALEASGLLT